MGRRSESLGALGGSVLALACAPKVPASIVVDASTPTPPGDKEQAEPVVREVEAAPTPTPAVQTEGDQPGPPRVVRVEQLTPTRLRIHFSEAIAPVGAFDPNDFRVSVLSVYLSPNSADSYAYYYDWGYQSYGRALRFTAAVAGSIQLDLEFEPEIAQYHCRMLEQAYDYHQGYGPPGVQSQVRLFLHYAAGSIPITDEAGTPLQNFGADWVIGGRADPPQTRLELTHAQIPQAGRSLAPIQCGPVIPPGPR